MRKKIKRFFDHVTGMRLWYRLLLIYILGGVLPMILICLYLVHGPARILIGQARQRRHFPRSAH